LVQLLRETVTALLPSWRLLKHTRAGTVLVNTITPPLWFPLARLAGATVVCHVHEAEGTASALIRRALYLPLVLCHRIVINSRFSLNVLSESAPWLAARTRIVYNAVTGPDHVLPARAHLEGAVRLLFIGRLSHRKGPHVAIEAVRLLRERGRDVRLDLLGAVFPGNEAYEDTLRSQVAEGELTDAVNFLGFRTSIWDTVAESDIVVIPSTVDEPFGNTAVEASLAGRPLVVSDIAGLKEASQAASGRIAVPGSDASAIADAVERMIEKWPEFIRRAAADAEMVSERFSSEQYSDGLIAAMSSARQEGQS